MSNEIAKAAHRLLKNHPNLKVNLDSIVKVTESCESGESDNRVTE